MKGVLAAVLIGFLIFGCLGQSQYGTTNADSTSNSISNKTGRLIEINMTAKQWDFIPNSITVKKGDHVRIYLTSLDVRHGFMLPEFNINAQVNPGNVTVVDFVADKEGQFTFRCSVVCGAGHSQQRGTLTIEP